jgi:hypothetical protein
MSNTSGLFKFPRLTLAHQYGSFVLAFHCFNQPRFHLHFSSHCLFFATARILHPRPRFPDNSRPLKTSRCSPLAFLSLPVHISTVSSWHSFPSPHSQYLSHFWKLLQDLDFFFCSFSKHIPSHYSIISTLFSQKLLVMPTMFIIPMPSPNVPHFKGQRITDFLDCLKAYATAVNIPLNDLLGCILRYCHRRVRKLIESSMHWMQHN